MNVDSESGQSRAHWAVPLALVLLTGVFYTARLSALPVVGEESRWARSAVQMIETGDWIVTRQQGRVFAERPPMTCWAIAVCGLVRGEVDAVAIRLPSVIAVVLTTLLIYCYTREFTTRQGAFIAGLVYATMVQVLQIGRMGESEALFALLVSSSLLLWHLGYVRRWKPAMMWSIGFGCAALAALVKGPQAPVYFVAITGVYLLARREWRALFHWSYALGAAVFAIIIALWMVPYYFVAGADAVTATWSGLAADRFHLGGMAKHVATYPLETLACLLPWSPILATQLFKSGRRLLREDWRLAGFQLTALAVAYPTVLLAAGARGRYFMPLYPCAAVLLGYLIERCATAVDGYPRRAWRQYAISASGIISALGIGMLVASLLPGSTLGSLATVRVGLAVASVGGLLAAAAIWANRRPLSNWSPVYACTAIGVFVSLVFSMIYIGHSRERWNDPTAVVAEFRQQIPDVKNLVSFSPIDHRFAYYYRDSIEELDWPQRIDETPDNTDYFVFMRYPGDTMEKRNAGRGRSWSTTPGVLPWQWEEVAAIKVARKIRDRPQPQVVLGRIVRPLVAGSFDVTTPQAETRGRGPTEMAGRDALPAK